MKRNCRARICTARIQTTWLGSSSSHLFAPRQRKKPVPRTTGAIRQRLIPNCTGYSRARCAAAPCLSSPTSWARIARSEEHTSELQSQSNLVCRLLLEKKKTISECIDLTLFISVHIPFPVAASGSFHHYCPTSISIRQCSFSHDSSSSTTLVLSHLSST